MPQAGRYRIPRFVFAKLESQATGQIADVLAEVRADLALIRKGASLISREGTIRVFGHASPFLSHLPAMVSLQPRPSTRAPGSLTAGAPNRSLQGSRIPGRESHTSLTLEPYAPAALVPIR